MDILRRCVRISTAVVLLQGVRLASAAEPDPGRREAAADSSRTAGLAVAASGRTAFLRQERDAAVEVEIALAEGAPVTDVRVEVRLAGATRRLRLPDLTPGGRQTVPVAVNTALRPDDYPLRVVVTGRQGAVRLQAEQEIVVSVVARPLPDQMPVVLWGHGDLERLKTIGFTHHLLWLADDGRVWAAGEPVPSLDTEQAATQGRMLDELLRQGLHGAVYVHPGTWVTGDPERKARYNRVDRAGQPRAGDNVCGNLPEISRFCYNLGASVARTFGQYPALNAALIHSEVRDGSDLCFHEEDRQACRAATGADIPAEVAGKAGLGYRRLKDFPADRVVADDHPLLRFYRWFWQEGDGWNGLHTQVHRGLKSTGRSDLWTFFDPAVRAPDVWGSGGEVDVVSQWTYSYPDPLKIGQAADELFAMAEGRPGQQVMKMTQVIWYRTGTAPELPADEARRAGWERAHPEAPFITIAPDHLREAFWAKIARPVRGIMYHGWQSLVETGSTTGYVFTHPATQTVLGELTRDVVQPLGPTLLQVPDRPADVAVLESFASQVFAGRGSYGWSESWEADLHLVLQWAHLQPRIVFDQTLSRDGLDRYRVLVMPFCDVLTESVVRRVHAFQQQGGLVVGDEFLCPAIVPDIVVPSFKRTGNPDADKAELQRRAAVLRQELDAFYSRYADASDPDVVLRCRQYGDADYLFVVNDRRTFGDYVGHHGKVMEQGLPLAAKVSVQRRSGVAYDLVRHQEVPVRATAVGLELDVDLGPGDGRLLMLADRRIARVEVMAPERARVGRALEVAVVVADSAGRPLEAVVPVRLEIADAAGRSAEFSGYYGALGGQARVRLDLAVNEAPGTWQITATELASEIRAQRRMAVVK